MINVVSFRLRGRFGHFLRAEAGASALSYPFPPRTVLLGMVGAVLGLEKDEAQLKLEPFQAAIAGKLPITHWHRAKLRKDPPELLPHEVKRSQSPDRETKPEKATLILQEWLFNPEYTVWVSLPHEYHEEFETRVRERRWHFQPSLGLSEMMADLEFLESTVAKNLPFGWYEVSTVLRQREIRFDVKEILNRKLALNILRMPRFVTVDRIFSHDSYVFERDGRSVLVESSDVYQAGDKVIMFL